jgi:hypothetical protein
MSACKRNPRCLMNAGHKGRCGTLRDLIDELANWAAQKVLDLAGYKGPR